MTSSQPEVKLASRYSVGETCQLLGISRNTLARYAKKGKIRFGIRASTGRRFYLGSEILKFWQKSW